MQGAVPKILKGRVGLGGDSTCFECFLHRGCVLSIIISSSGFNSATGGAVAAGAFESNNLACVPPSAASTLPTSTVLPCDDSASQQSHAFASPPTVLPIPPSFFPRLPKGLWLNGRKRAREFMSCVGRKAGGANAAAREHATTMRQDQVRDRIVLGGLPKGTRGHLMLEESAG